MKEKKIPLALFSYSTWTGFMYLVYKAAGTNTLSKVLNPFIPIPKNEGREVEKNKGRDAEFLTLLQWYIMEIFHEKSAVISGGGGGGAVSLLEEE